MRYLVIFFAWALMGTAVAAASGNEYTKYYNSFKNFITCELTRTDAVDHFKGKPFKITMVKLHNVAYESGMIVLTGAVQCHVKDSYITLYPAVGVETVVDKKQVSYYTIRKESFSILASELYKYPYNERCPWSRYWINLD